MLGVENLTVRYGSHTALEGATVRFEAPDDEIAKQIAPAAAQGAGTHAEILGIALRRQSGTRWPLV